MALAQSLFPPQPRPILIGRVPSCFSFFLHLSQPLSIALSVSLFIHSYSSHSFVAQRLHLSLRSQRRHSLHPLTSFSAALILQYYVFHHISHNDPSESYFLSFLSFQHLINIPRNSSLTQNSSPPCAVWLPPPPPLTPSSLKERTLSTPSPATDSRLLVSTTSLVVLLPSRVPPTL